MAKKQKLLWGWVNNISGKARPSSYDTREMARSACPLFHHVKRIAKHGTGYRIVGKG
jgi:hypothetical protein